MTLTILTPKELSAAYFNHYSQWQSPLNHPDSRKEHGKLYRKVVDEMERRLKTEGVQID